jgi:hypothetical protein
MKRPDEAEGVGRAELRSSSQPASRPDEAEGVGRAELRSSSQPASRPDEAEGVGRAELRSSSQSASRPDEAEGVGRRGLPSHRDANPRQGGVGGQGGARARRATRRLAREERTVLVMLAMYCRAHHRGNRTASGLCLSCSELADYAHRRLARCPYSAQKPTCARCTTHCYAPQMRERMRVVMRYAGPRMLRTHPILALAHLADGRRGDSRRR